MTNRFRTFPGAWAILAFICIASFSTMVWVSNQEPATMDELAHIPSGYAYIRYLDFRLNPEHPPLLKALAGLPLLFGGFKFPTENAAWTTMVNGQWDMGRAFLYESGNDANTIVHLARIGPMLLTILLIFLTYRSASELMGRRWALIPALLVGLSPNFLAHGHYVTTDVIAAFGVVLATYYFIRMLHAPSWRSLIFASLAFGVAELGKFSAVLLIPYFVLLVAIYAFAQGLRAAHGGGWLWGLKKIALALWSHGWKTIALMALGFALVIYPAYFIFTINYPVAKQVSDTTSILTTFKGGPVLPGMTCNIGRCMADMNIWLAGNPVLRPAAQYVLGVLMVMQRSAGGNRNYFLGEDANSGTWYYFPVVYALKEPLPVLLLIALAMFGGIWVIARRTYESKFLHWQSMTAFVKSSRGMVTLGTITLAYFLIQIGYTILLGLAGGKEWGPLLASAHFYQMLSTPDQIGMLALLLVVTIIMGSFLSSRAWKQFFDWLGVNFTEFAMLTFVIFYWAYSIKSPLNIGFRHLFPTLPFIYILTAGYWKGFITSIRIPQTASILGTLVHGFRTVFASSLKYLTLIFLLTWFLLETIVSAPYYLSYFNQLGSGMNEGYRYVTDSNYDWGQDLLRLKTFVAEHPEMQKIGVHYFGGGNPKYYLGAKEENWWSARGNPAKDGIHYLAVSINELQGSIQPIRMVKDATTGAMVPEFVRPPEDEYRWLTDLRPSGPGMGGVPAPDYRVGTTIFVYKL